MPSSLMFFLLFLGFLTGIINGLLGVGGGTLLVPAMVLLLGVTQHQAHGTSLAVILPTAAVSTLIYNSFGNLNLSLALAVASTGILGGYLGARLLNHIPALQLRQLFGLFMILAGLRMVV